MRAGHLAPSLLMESFGLECDLWWPILAPWVQRMRAEDQDETIFEHFEWTATLMGRGHARLGSDEAMIERLLEGSIASQLSSLRDFEAMRTVIVASPSAGAIAD